MVILDPYGMNLMLWVSSVWPFTFYLDPDQHTVDAGITYATNLVLIGT